MAVVVVVVIVDVVVVVLPIHVYSSPGVSPHSICFLSKYKAVFFMLKHLHVYVVKS